MGTSNDMGDIVIIDDGQEIDVSSSETFELISEDEIVVVTPRPSLQLMESTEETPAPSYSPDTLLLAENQVNGLAVQTALTGLFLGFILGVEVLKIWLTGTR